MVSWSASICATLSISVCYRDVSLWLIKDGKFFNVLESTSANVRCMGDAKGVPPSPEPRLAGTHSQTNAEIVVYFVLQSFRAG